MAETGRMALKVAALTSAEKQGLQTFVRRVQQAYPDQIRRVSLFGSKARGDSNPDSDVDVLVIVAQEDRLLRRGIIDIASDVSLEYNILLSPRVISEQRWETRQGFRLYQNIARDALTISIKPGK